ncbi:MAG: hypothetical protein ACI350_08105 [Prevotella sp.]
MKKKIKYGLLVCASFLLAACSDENQEARTPIASMTISTTELNINESMEIHFNGIADQVVIYTGDQGHDYELRESSNTGYVVNKGLFTYSYSVPGSFKVVCVASTYDTFMGNGLSNDTTSFIVNVKDDVTTIDQIYSTITPNVFYAEAINNTDWVLRLPTKQVYNGKEIAINAKKQRVTMEIKSESSSIFVDDNSWSKTTYYDLTAQHDIRVVSNYGSVREYKLHTIIYPEFTAISINDIKGTLKRNAYYQNELTYKFTLPANSDASHIIPTFTTDANVKFYADGTEIKSGDTIDLTKQGVSYTLVRTDEGNANVTAVSTVLFDINI